MLYLIPVLFVAAVLVLMGLTSRRAADPANDDDKRLW